MGKVTLNLEVDAELVAEIEQGGVDPVQAAKAGLDAAAERLRASPGERRPRPWPKASDPETAERLAREWAEANKEAIEEHKRLIAQRGSFADSARRW